jgi:glucose dehydrogenase
MKRRTVVVVSAPGLIVLAVLALSRSGLSAITADAVTAADTPSGANAQSPDLGSWPGSNRTLRSQRYSPLSPINTQTLIGRRAA